MLLHIDSKDWSGWAYAFDDLSLRWRSHISVFVSFFRLIWLFSFFKSVHVHVHVATSHYGLCRHQVIKMIKDADWWGYACVSFSCNPDKSISYLPWGRKSYLITQSCYFTQNATWVLYIGCIGTHAHGCQVTSWLCSKDVVMSCRISAWSDLFWESF